MSLKSGQTLAHYRVVEPIGKGGMGEVYRARDSKLGRDVAIKVLPGEFSRDQQRLDRFRREARLLAQLNHPNIATLHGLEKADGQEFLVMELVEGVTLAERIADGPIPLDEVIPLFAQMARGLEAAHEKNIVHRDLKPANVMIGPDGQVKILDFGLAKAFATSEEHDVDLSQSPTQTRGTEIGVIVGTLSYMSPEQVRGKPADKRADVWAFGCCLYEAVTSKKAIAGETSADIVAHIVGSEPDWVPVSSLSIERLLRLLLRKDARERLRDMGDVRIELETQASVSDARAADSPAPRGRGLVATLMVLGAAIVGAVIGITLVRPSGGASSRALARVEMSLPPEYTLAEFGRGVAISPDGENVVYSTYGPLLLRSLAEPEAAPIPGTAFARGPFFSPDGNWIGFWHEGLLKKIAVDGGAPIVLCPAQSLFGASWSIDDRIVFGQGPSGVFEVSADGGDAELLIKPDAERDEVAMFGPELLPDGRSLLVSILRRHHNWDGADIVVQRLDTGERQVVVEGGTDARFVPTGHLVFSRDRTLHAVAFDPKNVNATGSPIPIQEGVGRSQLWESGGGQFSFSMTGTLVYAQPFAPLARTLVWVERNGREEALSMPARFYMHPRLSPDGRRIVVDTVDTLDLWIYELDRGTMERLTVEKTHLHPVWSADGARVIFDATQAHALYWKSLESGQPSELLVDDPLNLITAVSVSPDGQALAVELSRDHVAYDIAILPLEGEPRFQPLLADPNFREMGPMFSPDGRWLAFVSDETGRDEVYVQPYPGPGRKRLISSAGGREPLWSPTGRELFYREGLAMMAVRVRTDPDFSTNKPEKLFEGRYGSEPISAHASYDVSRDGQRFLMVKDLGGFAPPDKLQLVLNWFDELTRLAPQQP